MMKWLLLTLAAICLINGISISAAAASDSCKISKNVKDVSNQIAKTQDSWKPSLDEVSSRLSDYISNHGLAISAIIDKYKPKIEANLKKVNACLEDCKKRAGAESGQCFAPEKLAAELLGELDQLINMPDTTASKLIHDLSNPAIALTSALEFLLDKLPNLLTNSLQAQQNQQQAEKLALEMLQKAFKCCMHGNAAPTQACSLAKQASKIAELAKAIHADLSPHLKQLGEMYKAIKPHLRTIVTTYAEYETFAAGKITILTKCLVTCRQEAGSSSSSRCADVDTFVRDVHKLIVPFGEQAKEPIKNLSDGLKKPDTRGITILSFATTFTDIFAIQSVNAFETNLASMLKRSYACCKSDP